MGRLRLPYDRSGLGPVAAKRLSRDFGPVLRFAKGSKSPVSQLPFLSTAGETLAHFLRSLEVGRRQAVEIYGSRSTGATPRVASDTLGNCAAQG